MPDIASLEKLKNYADARGYRYRSSEDSNITPQGPVEPTANVKFISMGLGGNLFFVSYDYFEPKAYVSTTYCGVYRPWHESVEGETIITKKEWANSLSGKHKTKSGKRKFDKYLSVYSKDRHQVKQIASDKFLNEYLKLAEVVKPVEFIIDLNYLSYLHDLKGRSLAGTVSSQWITDPSVLDEFITKSRLLLAGL